MISLDDAMTEGATPLYSEAPGTLVWIGSPAPYQTKTSATSHYRQRSACGESPRRNQRMDVASMETRGATGVYDKASDSYTLHVCSQSADSCAILLLRSWVFRMKNCA